MKKIITGEGKGTSIQAYKKESEAFVKKANISISSKEDMSKADMILTQLNQKLDAVTKEREKVTKPINEALKAERARWKPIETALANAIQSIRSGMSAYQTEQFKIAEAEAAKIAARVGPGKGKLKLDTAAVQIAGIEKPDARLESTKFSKVKTFTVVDISKLPTEYVIANESEIRKAMNAGIELPGVEYDFKLNPINSR